MPSLNTMLKKIHDSIENAYMCKGKMWNTNLYTNFHLNYESLIHIGKILEKNEPKF